MPSLGAVGVRRGDRVTDDGALMAEDGQTPSRGEGAPELARCTSGGRGMPAQVPAEGVDGAVAPS